MEDNKNRSRRTVLKTSAATIALGGVGVAGAREADDTDPEQKKESPADSGSIELTASAAGKKSDWEDTMEARQERSGFGALDEELSTDTYNPGPNDNIEYVDHWKHDSETTASWPIGTVTEGEHLCTLFEAIDDDGNPLTDSDGNYYYMVELYSQQEGTSTPIGYSSGRVERIENNVETIFDSRSFGGRDPATTSNVNGEWVTVGYSAGVGSVSLGAEEAIYVDNGTFGPDTWTPGEDGEYTVFWDGSDKGTVDVLAFVEVTSEFSITDMDHNGLSWEWAVWDNYYSSH